MVLALFLVPFFSLANDNIFENGVVDLKPASKEAQHCISANYYDYTSTACGDSESDAKFAACNGAVSQYPDQPATQNKNGYTGRHCKSNLEVWSTLVPRRSCGNCSPEPYKHGSASFHSYTFSEIEKCPPENYPSYIYQVQKGDNLFCADPNQINLVDSCNNNSDNAFLNVQVTASYGCFTQPDGSVCGYNAVDMGEGNTAYQLDLEGDCYSEVHPDLDGNPQLSDMPTNDGCEQSGLNGLLVCTSTPEESCPGGVCDEGCGYMEGQFVCIQLPDPDNPDPDNPDTGEPCTENCTPSVSMQGVEDGLKAIEDELKKELSPVQKGSFDIDSATAAMLAKQEAYKLKLQSIKAEASTLITPLSTSGGSFDTCYDITQFRGKTERKCLDQYADEMEPIRNGILFIFTIISAFIVLRGIGGKGD